MENSKENFEVIEDGTTYLLPKYTVVEGKGIETTGEANRIDFVRGSKINEGVEKNDGIVHESMLSMMIYDLSFKNELVPSKETEYTLECLTAALGSMQVRSRERKSRQVEGTYKK